MIISDYLIIGSGPIGVFTLKYLLEKGHKVTIVDNSKKINPKITEQIFNLKDFKQNSEVYDLNNTAIYKGKKIMPVSSKSKGGFTKVWGGTLNALSNEEIIDTGMSIKEYNKTYKKILESIPNSIHTDGSLEAKNHDSSKKFEESLLAINRDNGEIWSCDELLNDLLKEYSESLIHLDNIDVKEVTEKKSNFEIKTKDRSLTVQVKKVFICTGSFSSSVIASRMTNSDYFTIGDSNLSVWPILKISRSNIVSKNNNMKNKAYTRFIVNFSRQSSIVKFQFYSINEEVIGEVIQKLPKLSKILVPFLKILQKRFYLTFAYKNSNNSSTGVFKIINEDIVKVKSIKPIKKINILGFFRIFLKNKLLLLPIKYNYGNFASFHSGNTQLFKNGHKLNFNDLGNLEVSDNIHFIDSTIMKFIPAGPFTISSIILSRLTLKKILNEK
jgi:hypothetical protein